MNSVMAAQVATTNIIHRAKPSGHYVSLEGTIHADVKMDVEKAIEKKDWRSELKIDSSPPLCRTTSVSPAILMPYRLMMFIRLVALIFFLKWRITHANTDAIWLWGICITGELWFCFSWLLDQLPKLRPVYRTFDIDALRQKYNFNTSRNLTSQSDLPAMDVFVTTADPEKEPSLVTANTILSILAVDYPVEKLSCYLSDDAGALLTFEALAEAADFAKVWVPFCRKHDIEPRNPEVYFSLKKNPYRFNLKVRGDYVHDRRQVLKEYDQFKARINTLPDVIRGRSKMFNAEKGKGGGTWMVDGTQWPGTWIHPSIGHAKGDHAGIVQVFLNQPSHAPQLGCLAGDLDFSSVDMRLPMLVYVSRQKHPGHDHQKKAGAMNALVRASAVLSNSPYILNLDCDHYVNNSAALLAGICFMLDNASSGDNVAFVQFPQRFDGVDPSDMWANHNRMFFDGTMRAMDGLQGPIYVGTGCLFRRTAIYGFDPPPGIAHHKKNYILPLHVIGGARSLLTTKFGNSINDAVRVVSCTYEDTTKWGRDIGWVYGTVTEDVVTGFRMHTRGWRSVYCAMQPDAFRGTAPINITDRLYQVLRWAAGSLEIFFSRNNPLLAGPKLHVLQRIAYLNVTTYPFSSVFLVVYCLLPAMSLLSKHFVPQLLTVTFVAYLTVVMAMLVLLALLELKWSGVTFAEWWRNEQFWMIAATSAYLAAVIQVTLKIVAGVEISFKLTSKQVVIGGGTVNDAFAELYLVKWTALMILPIAITTVNVIALVIAAGEVMYAESLVSWTVAVGVIFNLWVLVHLYPFAKGLMGWRGEKMNTVIIWAAFVIFTMALIYIVMQTNIAYNVDWMANP